MEGQGICLMSVTLGAFQLFSILIMNLHEPITFLQGFLLCWYLSHSFLLGRETCKKRKFNS